MVCDRLHTARIAICRLPGNSAASVRATSAARDSMVTKPCCSPRGVGPAGRRDRARTLSSTSRGSAQGAGGGDAGASATKPRPQRPPNGGARGGGSRGLLVLVRSKECGARKGWHPFTSTTLAQVRAARRSSSTASPGAGAARRFSSAATSAAKSESRKGSGKYAAPACFPGAAPSRPGDAATGECEGAIAGELRQAYLAVSHRWETPQEPDTHGEQQKAIQRYLIEHPDEWVWFDDKSCRKERTTPAEKVMFVMLRRINLLYLGARVLVLQDLSYQSRFGTQSKRGCPSRRPRPRGSCPPRWRRAVPRSSRSTARPRLWRRALPQCGRSVHRRKHMSYSQSLM